jgi:adenylate cyclase
MFTDMVGYTALGQRNETLSLALVEEQKKLIRPVLSRHNGREVKTIGDAFLVEFPSALDAVRCAYDIQRATREFNLALPAENRIHLRIGVHVGEVLESGGDISGDAVNVASRVEPLSEDGGVCVTQQVYDHVRNKLDLPVTSLGPRALKNVEAPVQVYKLGLPWEKESAPAPKQDKKRIAVLPLTNISHDQSDEYFADGMTEELINALSHVQGLRVIARTSVARYKGTPKSVSEIGRELAVGSVMEGSVRKAGDRVRVTTQLIDVSTEEHLWSENYDRKVEDIFAIQSDVAGMVAEALKAKLLSDEKRRLEAGYTTNAKAYDKYLLAKHSTARDRFTILRLYEEAITLDPNFAQALAAIGNFYIIIAGDYIPLKEGFSKARAYIDRAMALDDQLPDVWNAKANYALQYEWNAQEAERCFRKAIELNPSNANAYAGCSFVVSAMGRHEEAVQLALREKALDPYPPYPSAFLPAALALADRGEEAIQEMDRIVELYPENPEVHLWCAEIYGLLGMSEKAVDEMELLLAIIRSLREKGTPGWAAGVPPGFLAMDTFSYAATGRVDRIRELISAAEAASKKEHVAHSVMGFLYLAAGNKEKAFDAFEKSLEERDPGLFMYSAVYLQLMKQVPQLYDSVHSDPRFASLLRRAGVQRAS